MKFISALALSLSTLVLPAGAFAATETYQIDPVHSSLGFTIRHFVSKVPGTFAQFTGVLTLDRDQMENSSVDATIQIGSVSTGNDKRDAHLKSKDFFDASQFGTATFKSKSFKKTGDTTYAITGDLSLHGVTKEVVLSANLLGFGDGMQGAKLVGWEATTTIKRADFGLQGPAMLGKALGEDAALTINIEADKK